MKIQLYQVDAFTDHIFGGNPAAVCPLQRWLPDQTLQKIASENFLPETAFFIPGERPNEFHLRWFTPEIELDLCGHATLATAHVLFNHLGLQAEKIIFHSLSGQLEVCRRGDLLSLDFPTRFAEPVPIPDILVHAIGLKPKHVLKARDYMMVFENEDEIRSISPDKTLLDLVNLDPGGIIVTARGYEVDFVSRFFTPQSSILEDPVTGSAHCTLIPYWSKVLGKTELTAHQISGRLGKLHCTDKGERVWIAGRSKTYLEGFIHLDL